MASPPKPKPRKRLNIAKETPCGRKQGISKSSSPGQEQGKDSSSANSDIRSSPVGKINERLRNQNNDSGSAELTTKQLFLKPEAENENNEPKTNSTENTERNFLSKDCGIDSAPAIPPKLFILRSKKELGNDFGNDDHTDDEDTSGPELPPKPLFLQFNIGEEYDPTYGSSTNNSPPPPLPPRNPIKKKEVDSGKDKVTHFSLDSSAVAYKIVDVASDWKQISEEYFSHSVEEDKGDHSRVIHQSSAATPNGNDQKVSDEDDHYDDTHPYEEIDLPFEIRPPSAGDVIATNNSKLNETVFQMSHAEIEQHVFLARHAKPAKRGWITYHRAEDFVDFEDIKFMLELKKNLQSASAKIAELERTVAMAKKNPVTVTQQSEEISEKKGGIAKDEGVNHHSTAKRLSGPASRHTFDDNCVGTAKARENSERECKHKPKERAVKRTISAPEDISYRNCTSEPDIFYTNSKSYEEKPSQTSEYEDMEAYLKTSEGGQYVNTMDKENTPEHPPVVDVEKQEQRYTQETAVNDERSLRLRETTRQDIRARDLNTDVILTHSTSHHGSQTLFPTEIYSNHPYDISDGAELPPPLPPKTLVRESRDYKELL